MDQNLDEIQGVFFYDPQDRIYQDHFPGHPIVPGSVIIESFFSAAKKAGLLLHGLIIDRFRFKAFVAPGAYGYRIHVGEKDIDCELYKGKQVVAKGCLKR